MAATLLGPDAVAELAGGAAVPFAVDFHDDAILQRAVLGIPADDEWLARTQERRRQNLDAFRWHIVPSDELATLAGLDPSRVLVVGNGTDPDIIQPMPWPSVPAIGMMSGAAPRRGIEHLIAAAELVREDIPELRLVLWLAATGEASAAYLDRLRVDSATRTWIEFASAPYDRLGPELGRATVQCIPNPPAEYWDAVSPIKLFDAMASGRPVVVTPRRAMRDVVERNEAGIVAGGDETEDLADAIRRLLSDEVLARRLGENARQAASASFAWSSISDRLAAQLSELAESA